jgi:hypothetical protein
MEGPPGKTLLIPLSALKNAFAFYEKIFSSRKHEIYLVFFCIFVINFFFGSGSAGVGASAA